MWDIPWKLQIKWWWWFTCIRLLKPAQLWFNPSFATPLMFEMLTEALSSWFSLACSRTDGYCFCSFRAEAGMTPDISLPADEIWLHRDSQAPCKKKKKMEVPIRDMASSLFKRGSSSAHQKLLAMAPRGTGIKNKVGYFSLPLHSSKSQSGRMTAHSLPMLHSKYC